MHTAPLRLVSLDWIAHSFDRAAHVLENHQHSPPNRDHPRRSLLPNTTTALCTSSSIVQLTSTLWSGHRAALNDRDWNICRVSGAIASSPVFGRQECAYNLAQSRDTHEHERCAISRSVIAASHEMGRYLLTIRTFSMCSGCVWSRE